MKKPNRFTFNAAILCLIWTIYYYAKRYTGGVINIKDNVVCGTVSLICAVIIVIKIVGIYQDKKGSKR